MEGRRSEGCESSSMRLIEQAQNELQMLETQHPQRFDYLKLELRSFIDQLLPSPHISCATSSSPPATQVSSTVDEKKKTRRKSRGESRKHCKLQRVVMKRRNRVEMVLERARSCLQKIRDVKSTLS